MSVKTEQFNIEASRQLAIAPAQALPRRVGYEYGGPFIDPTDTEKKQRHGPMWATTVMGGIREQYGRPVENLIISQEDWPIMVNQLEGNLAYADLSVRWAVQNKDWDTYLFGSYGGSSSTTNIKEMLQTYSIARMITSLRQDQRKGAAFYFIDTRSHPMRNEFWSEILMYAATSGKPVEAVAERYLALHADAINPHYIDPVIAKFDQQGASSSLRTQIQSIWHKREKEHQLPCDAYNLPKFSEYKDFYEFVGMHPQMIELLEKSYLHIHERGLSKDLGTLRCAMFSHTGEILSAHMQDETPLVVVPDWAVSKQTGFDGLTIAQVQALSQQFYGNAEQTDNPLVFNVLDIQDEDTLGEAGIPMYGNLYENDPLMNEYVRIAMNMPIRDISAIGHNSGNTYYLRQWWEGLPQDFLPIITVPKPKQAGGSIFFGDNYEAPYPYVRRARNDHLRKASKSMMAFGVRGWVRLQDYIPQSQWENLAYGDSPRAEPVLDTLLKHPQGFKAASQSIDLTFRYPGKNWTFGVDIGTKTKIYAVRNNDRMGALIQRKPDIELPIIVVNPEQLDTIMEHEDPEHLITGPEKIVLNGYNKVQGDIHKREQDIEQAVQEFNEEHAAELQSYWQRRIDAIHDAGKALGISTRPTIKSMGTITEDQPVTLSLDRISDQWYDAYSSALIEMQEERAKKVQLEPNTPLQFYYDHQRISARQALAYDEALNIEKASKRFSTMLEKKDPDLLLAIQANNLPFRVDSPPNPKLDSIKKTLGTTVSVLANQSEQWKWNEKDADMELKHFYLSFFNVVFTERNEQNFREWATALPNSVYGRYPEMHNIVDNLDSLLAWRKAIIEAPKGTLPQMQPEDEAVAMKFFKSFFPWSEKVSKQTTEDIYTRMKTQGVETNHEKPEVLNKESLHTYALLAQKRASIIRYMYLSEDHRKEIEAALKPYQGIWDTAIILTIQRVLEEKYCAILQREKFGQTEDEAGRLLITELYFKDAPITSQFKDKVLQHWSVLMKGTTVHKASNGKTRTTSLNQFRKKMETFQAGKKAQIAERDAVRQALLAMKPGKDAIIQAAEKKQRAYDESILEIRPRDSQ